MDQNKRDEELYKAALTAFFKNEMEADKIILGLSIAAIGFYMALFTSKELYLPIDMIIIVVVSLCAFFITAGLILGVFARNKNQLLHMIKNVGSDHEDKILEFLDKWKYLPFSIGILTSATFTILLIFNNIYSKDLSMNNEKTKTEKMIKKNGIDSISAGVSGVNKANNQPDKKDKNGK